MSVKVRILALLGVLLPVTPGFAAPKACDISVCMAGAFARTDGANPRLAKICQRRKGLVQSCQGEACQPLFHFAAIDPAHQAIFKAKDSNSDGKVDARDRPATVCVVGYSWGGVNAAEVARRYVNDPRVAPKHRQIDRLDLIDPFAPMTQTIAVPKGVKTAVNHRHSKAPKYDCSSRAPLGPYKGLPMTCAPGVHCVDRDYSTVKAHAAQTLMPAQIGHCSIIRAIAPLLAP